MQGYFQAVFQNGECKLASVGNERYGTVGNDEEQLSVSAETFSPRMLPKHCAKPFAVEAGNHFFADYHYWALD